MKIAVIGKGFVGTNLVTQLCTTVSCDVKAYDSKSINWIGEHHYDTVFCAAPSADKWLANARPRDDYELIEKFERQLRFVKCDEFIHLSTIDAGNYGSELYSYGRNRFALEQFVIYRFAASVIRLPGLFGPGLKKNLLFDIKYNQDYLKNFNLKSTYQFYNINKLLSDVLIRKIPGQVVTFVNPPLSVKEIMPKHLLKKHKFNGGMITYDQMGEKEPYLSSKKAVLREVKEFLNEK